MIAVPVRKLISPGRTRSNRLIDGAAARMRSVTRGRSFANLPPAGKKKCLIPVVGAADRARGSYYESYAIAAGELVP